MLKKKSILLLFLLYSNILCDLTNSIDTDSDQDIDKVNAKKLDKSKKLAKKLKSDKDSVKNDRAKSRKLIKGILLKTLPKQLIFLKIKRVGFKGQFL